VPIRKRHVLTVLVVALVVVAGCGGSGTQGETSADGQSGNQGADSDWCPAGQSTQFANPQTGEQVSLVFQGTVTYEGRQVCKATWETNDPEGDVVRVEMYFSEDESYRKVVTYDADGNVLNEMQMSGSSDQPDSGGETPDGSGDGTSASQWCPEGERVQFSNPQTGEQTSMVTEGIVTHEGRQVCKATWETNDPEGEIARIVMYYTEERSYQKVVYYDGDGNVVLEQEQSADG
jgi:hypothetical protein